MKLLILTQKVDIDDDILGFFHDWIKEFAKHCERVTVVCLQRGRYELPKNVRVLSLGKDEFLRLGKYSGFIRKLVATLRFYNCIIQERKKYDKVFVHMNPEYIVLGGIFWKLGGKKIALWYTHKAVDLKLKLAAKLADIIFTASEESFRLPSRKVKIVGHGINIERFQVQSRAPGVEIINNNKFIIITVGRISPVKDYETMIKAIYILNNQGIKNIELDIIGAVVLKNQESYLNALKDMVEKMQLAEKVKFLGSIPHYKIPEYLGKSDLFINLSKTGSVDKAVLEAMACGCLPLSSNESFKKIIPDELIVAKNNPEKLAEKIREIIGKQKEERDRITQKLRQIVMGNHNLNNLIKTIVKEI
ncbi:MAG: glycosyltransferase family 4 protein [Patescibacteria group bacterium]